MLTFKTSRNLNNTCDLEHTISSLFWKGEDRSGVWKCQEDALVQQYNLALFFELWVVMLSRLVNLCVCKFLNMLKTHSVYRNARVQYNQNINGVVHNCVCATQHINSCVLVHIIYIRHILNEHIWLHRVFKKRLGVKPGYAYVGRHPFTLQNGIT